MAADRSTVRPPRSVPGCGLSSAQVAERVRLGLTNNDPLRRVNDLDVVRRNSLSLFNIVLTALIASLFLVGEIRDGLFVGTVSAVNLAISTGQEIIATRRLQALQALAAPRVTAIRDGMKQQLHAAAVVRDDLLSLQPGDQVIADGRIESGAAEFDESVLTGESANVARGPGEEVRSGTFCTAGECTYRAERVGAEAYAVQLTAEARDKVTRLTPLMLQFNRLLRVLLTVTAVLAGALFIQFNMQDRALAESLKATTATVTTVVPVGMLLGITVVVAVGALRVSRAGAIVQDMYAVEALNYVDVVAFDKTGTLTSNQLEVDEFIWVGSEDARIWLAAFATLAEAESKTVRAIARRLGAQAAPDGARVLERVGFSSSRRWSGIAWDVGGVPRAFVLGPPDMLLNPDNEGSTLLERYARVRRRGLRGVVFGSVATFPPEGAPPASFTPLALVILADELRPEAREAFELMATLDIDPRVISGDHPETVVALLSQLGVTMRGGLALGPDLEALSGPEFARAVADASVFGRIEPALKARIVTELQAQHHFVAMVGDGANDVPALRAADIGVAMASGAPMANAVAGIVLLNDSFTALIRGTREATLVLGNCGRLAKLFLAKTVYAFLLILATNMLGLDFPFLPRQGGVTSTLTLGIPALCIAVSRPTHSSAHGLVEEVLRFALPAGFALAASGILLQLIVEGVLDRGIEEARTLVNLTTVVVGVAYVVQIVGLEDVNVRRPARPVVTLGLAVLLLTALVGVMSEPHLREFFAFTQVSRLGWASVLVASVATLWAQHLLTEHWRSVVDFLVARPSDRHLLRGKAASLTDSPPSPAEQDHRPVHRPSAPAIVNR